MLPPGLELLPDRIRGIAPASSFELPCAIHATLRAHSRIDVGAFTGIYGGVIGPARIGRFCSIAAECVIAQDEHPADWLSTSMLQYVPNLHGWRAHVERMGTQFNAPVQPFTSNRGVVVGNDVWVGYRVYIRAGVTIGDGAIVGAGSIVVKDVPPYHIVAGNPARLIRPRFDAVTIERLIRLQWWRYDVFRIPALDFSQIYQALDMIELAVKHGIVSDLRPTVVTAAEIQQPA